MFEDRACGAVCRFTPARCAICTAKATAMARAAKAVAYATNIRIVPSRTVKGGLRLANECGRDIMQLSDEVRQ